MACAEQMSGMWQDFNQWCEWITAQDSNTQQQQWQKTKHYSYLFIYLLIYL